MKASIDLDQLKKLNMALILRKNTFKEEANKLLVQHGRLLIKDCVKWTPPFGDDESTAKQQGEKAVSRDVNKAVSAFTDDSLTNKELITRLKDIESTKDYEAANAILENIPKMKKWKILPFNPSLHTSIRKFGDRLRVKESQHKLTLDNPQQETWVKEEKGTIGSLKATWLAAANKLGIKLPGWISRHSDSIRYGTCDVQLGDNPRIRITNNGLAHTYLRKAADLAIKLRTRALINDFRNKLNKVGVKK